jgi:aspartyl-tRNA synthetase
MQGWVHAIDLDGGSLTLRSYNRLIPVQCLAPGPRSLLEEVRVEDVVRVQSSPAPEGSDTLICVELEVVNRCKALPFAPARVESASAALRSRYRYLELRNPEVQQLLVLRHRFVHAMSCALDGMGFISVETPVLATPSASGAREFRVVSLRSPSVAYALPQSPQVYGQLLVMGGVEKYYQWARCFRDEDLRANRQPEFTQLHLEAAFVGERDLMQIIETLLSEACAAIGLSPGTVGLVPFDEAQRRYGTDKPDLRYDVVPTLLPYAVMDSPEGGEVVCTRWPDQLALSGTDIETIREIGRQCRFTLLGFFDEERTDKRFAPRTVGSDDLHERLDLRPTYVPGLAPLWAGRWTAAEKLAKAIYTYLSQKAAPGDDTPRFVWVTEFPLFASDEEQPGKLAAQNSPFTAPVDEAALLEARKNKDLLKLKGRSFDLVLNGQEVGSGSILIHRREVQQHVLNVLGLSRQEVRLNYGFILDALQFGTPPVGGVGLGVDRLLSYLLAKEKIRDVIAFPKTKQGYCPVTRVDEKAWIVQAPQLPSANGVGVEGG